MTDTTAGERPRYFDYFAVKCSGRDQGRPIVVRLDVARLERARRIREANEDIRARMTGVRRQRCNTGPTE